MDRGEANAIKSGYLYKRSKYMKEWRKRWVVLTSDSIYSYKTKESTSKPTESIDLKRCSTVRTADDEIHKDNSFKLDSGQRTFYFYADSQTEKEGWIGAIGRAMVQPSVMISGEEENAYNGGLQDAHGNQEIIRLFH